MEQGSHAGIVVEQAGRDAYRGKIGRLAGNQRTADPTEGPEAARRRLILVDQVLAGDPAELLLLDMDVGRKARPGELAAIAAMAMGHRARGFDFEAHAATGAAAFDHVED